MTRRSECDKFIAQNMCKNGWTLLCLANMVGRGIFLAVNGWDRISWANRAEIFANISVDTSFYWRLEGIVKPVPFIYDIRRKGRMH